MVAGIFNTTRVVSEGVALVAHHLRISDSVKLSAVDYSTIGQRLVMGDIQPAGTDASPMSSVSHRYLKAALEPCLMSPSTHFTALTLAGIGRFC